MNSIIITSIICVSIITTVGIICYSNYRQENGKELEHIHKRLDIINEKINLQHNVIGNIYNVVKRHEK